jgi:hypothetical protein
MATHTPPPYFPQDSLSPADPHKYRKFKLTLFGIIFLLLLLLAAAIACAVYLFKWLF